MHNTAVMFKCKITVNVETQYTGNINFFNAPLANLKSHWYQPLVFFYG